MRKTIAALAFAGAVGLVAYQSAGAMPVDTSGINTAVQAASTPQPVRYYRHWHRGYVKCYYELVIGPYRCHRFHRW